MIDKDDYFKELWRQGNVWTEKDQEDWEAVLNSTVMKRALGQIMADIDAMQQSIVKMPLITTEDIHQTVTMKGSLLGQENLVDRLVSLAMGPDPTEIDLTGDENVNTPG